MNGARLFTIALALFALLPARAQMPTNIPRGIGFEVGAMFQPGARTDVQEGGSLQRDRWSIELQYRIPVEAVQARIGVDLERSEYQIEGDPAYADLPLEADYRRIQLNVRGLTPGGWWWMVAPALRSGAFEGADRSDGQSAYLLTLISPAPSNRLAFSFGFIARTHPEEDPEAFPILGLQWRITAQWILRTSDELMLMYVPGSSSPWQLEGRVAYRRREYRLPVSAEPWSEGVLADRQIMPTVALRWRPIPPLLVHIFAGYAFAQTVDLEARDGERIAQTEADPQPLAGLECRMRF